MKCTERDCLIRADREDKVYDLASNSWMKRSTYEQRKAYIPRVNLKDFKRRYKEEDSD